MPTELSPAAVNLVLELRKSFESEFRDGIIRSLRGKGMGVDEIIMWLGVSRSTVYRALRRTAEPDQDVKEDDC